MSRSSCAHDRIRDADRHPLDPALQPGKTWTCTLSKPWWTAWFDCPVTPVEGGLWPARRAGDDGLARIPWVQAEPSASGVVAHLFSGSRPLHTDNHFPDGARAKVLWTFPRPVSRFAMTATDLGNPGTPLTIWEVDADGTASDASDQVPTYLDIPSAGCWRVEVRAQDEAGEFMASATFVVIDG